MDVTAVDELLTTTRAVIEECLALAIQAPTGSNAQRWRFVVVPEAGKREALADIYRQVWERYEREQVAALRSISDERAAQQRRVLDSARYLAENLHRAPVHVIPCALGRVDASAHSAEWAGFLGSIFPAVWSFQLALRSRGLGSVLTTLHLYGEAEAAQILGIPDTVTQVALIPVAYTKGDDFKPAARRPAAEITYWNSWKSP